VFDRQKTMYDGKRVQAGHTTYVFASENESGSGLIARGTVTASAQRRESQEPIGKHRE
jgi:hypothetical protein